MFFVLQCVKGRKNFIHFWDAITGPKEDKPAGETAPVTAPVETRGSPATQELSSSGNLSSAESKGATEPIASDLAGSSESMGVVETVQLPPPISEAIADSQVVVDSTNVLQEGALDSAPAQVGLSAQTNAPAGAMKSLQSLVVKYCVNAGFIDLDRISPGNNPRIVKDCNVKIIKDSIVNSAWDDYTLFIISVVTDDNTLTDPVKVRSTPDFLAFVINNCCYVFVNGHHRDLALKILKSSNFSEFSLPSKVKCQVCVGISNWDHFLISKKANFVPSSNTRSCHRAIHDHASERKTGGEKY